MKGIITLCGSTKFKEEFINVNASLTLSGWIVLSVGTFHHSDPEIFDLTMQRKEMLDKLHKKKISLSEAIFVIDVGGYEGESTKSEIKHAKNLGLPVYYYTGDDLEKLCSRVMII